MRAPGPGWLTESKARIFFDMHLPSWRDKGIAERFDPRAVADSFAEAGADSAVLFAKCQYGNFYTAIHGEHLHPGLGGRDLMEETASLLGERGIRTLAYYSVSWDERMADEHPEWLAVNAAGERGKGPYRWRTLCINGAYADLVEKHLLHIAQKSIHGIWLDMTIVGEGNCYCPRCREAFRARFHRELPARPAEPGWAEALSFRADLVEALYARLRAALRAAAPHLVFTNNYWGYPWSSAEMGSRAVGATASVDFLTGEAYSDWTGIRSTSLLPTFLRSVAAGRPFEALIGTGVNTWDYTRKPAAYLSYEAFASFAHGATVTVDDQPFADGSFDRALYATTLKDVFHAMAAARETVAGVPARYVGIYHSQRAKDRATDQRDFVRDVSGSFRFFHDLRLPVDFVFDEAGALPGPAEVPLLVVPGVMHLSADEWGRLSRYMTDGGLVLAAGGLGGDRETLRSLSALGLEQAPGSAYSLSYLRLPGASDRDLLVRGRAQPFLRGGALPPGSAQGEIIDPLCETTPQEFFHNNLPAPHKGSGFPALFEVPVGKGCLAVFPQPLFRHYAKEPSAELRKAVAALVARHCPQPRVRLLIPMKLDFAIVEAQDALYVHLLNPSVEPTLCCGLMDIYDGRFERSYEYMEETVPVHDLRMMVHRSAIGPVTTLRERSGVQVQRKDDGWEIAVERVALWEIVKVPLGPGAWTTARAGAWH